MAITYDDTNKVLTVEDVASESIFGDIHQTDVANGWNVFHKIADNVYSYENIKLRFKNSDVSDSDVVLNIKHSNADSYFHTFDINGGSVNFTRCQFNFINSHIETWCGWYPSSGTFKNCLFTSPIQRQAIYCSSPNTNDIVFEQCYIDAYFIGSNAKYKDTMLAGKNGFIVGPTEGQLFENVSFYGSYCFYIPHISITIKGGTINPVGNIATLRDTILFELYNANTLNKRNQIFYDDGYEGDLLFTYNVIFKIYDEDGNELSDKKLRIKDKDGNIVYDGMTKNVKLKEYDYHIVGDGAVHIIDEQDYNSYLPYTYEVYDDLMTYYEGCITELVPNKLIEVSIAKPDRNIFSDLDEIKNQLQSHRDTVEPNVNEIKNQLQSHRDTVEPNVNEIKNQLQSHRDTVEPDIDNLKEEIQNHRDIVEPEINDVKTISTDARDWARTAGTQRCKYNN